MVIDHCTCKAARWIGIPLHDCKTTACHACLEYKLLMQGESCKLYRGMHSVIAGPSLYFKKTQVFQSTPAAKLGSKKDKGVDMKRCLLFLN
eukprot:1138931-Pelagomonas_calceolata.AAC.1